MILHNIILYYSILYHIIIDHMCGVGRPQGFEGAVLPPFAWGNPPKRWRSASWPQGVWADENPIPEVSLEKEGSYHYYYHHYYYCCYHYYHYYYRYYRYYHYDYYYYHYHHYYACHYH